MITIENDTIRLSINLKGAEMSSLYNKSNGLEYLWQADPHHWARHAPILFPIVGKLKNDEYRYEGRIYSLSQHGFARDMEFEMIMRDDYSATFQLDSTMGTRLAYPFKFRLLINYTLEKNKVHIRYEVKNRDHNPLYFSIGAHPAFNCPLREGEKRSDYQFVFEKEETFARHEIRNGLRTGGVEVALESTRILPIADDLFEKDAWVLAGLKSSSIGIQKGEERILTFQFSGFPYLGLWSKSKDSPFVCIEPWFGMADLFEHNQELVDKEGLVVLEDMGEFSCNYSIEILD